MSQEPTLFSPWLTKFAADSGDSLVQSAEQTTTWLLRRARNELPQKYGWRISAVDALIGEIRGIHGAAPAEIEKAMRVYWLDVAREIEAYEVMTVWRGAELAEDVVAGLNSRRVLSPAILSRSLLELAVSFLYDANHIKKIVDQAVSSPHPAVLSKDLEKLLLRALWATRLGNPPDHLQAVNVLTRIKFLSRNPKAGPLLATYEFLCEVAHPNALGSARFQAAAERVVDKGIRIVEIDRNAEFLAAADLREKTLWALSWSSYCINSGFDMTSSSVTSIARRWPA